MHDSPPPRRRLPHWLLRAALACLLTPPLVAAAIAAEPARGERIATIGTVPGRAACAACHLANGAGQPSNGIPALAGLPARYLVDQLDAFAAGERDSVIMAPYAARLNAAERHDVAAWFASLPSPPRHTPSGPDDAARRAQLARGKDIFDHGLPQVGLPACARCHGEAGHGIADFSPPIAGQSEAYLARQLEHWHTGTSRDPDDDFMRAASTRLSPADIAAVSTYTAQLPSSSAPSAHGDQP